MTAEDKKIPAKEALLLAAEKLFTEKGYAAVGTRELADEAQVNLGAIQYHFGSKEALFIETVNRLMCAKKEANQLLHRSTEINSIDDASRELCLFFRGFLKDVCQPCGPNVCKLMFREILDTTSQEGEIFKTLVSLVVEQFIRPVDDHLKLIIKTILPKAERQEVELAAHTVIGQCTFYITHRPFIEKLRSVSLEDEKILLQIANYISTFTLRGFGLNDKEIANAIEAANIS